VNDPTYPPNRLRPDFSFHRFLVFISDILDDVQTVLSLNVSSGISMPGLFSKTAPRRYTRMWATITANTSGSFEPGLSLFKDAPMSTVVAFCKKVVLLTVISSCRVGHDFAPANVTAG
jgi:hypothetical protein